MHWKITIAFLQITSALNLEAVNDREYVVMGCSAKTGENLQEGLEWVVEKVNEAEDISESKGR